MGDLMNDEDWRLARLERLGLKEDPFKLSADPRYLYLGPEHLAVYRQAQGVISRRRGLALDHRRHGHGQEFAGAAPVRRLCLRRNDRNLLYPHRRL